MPLALAVQIADEAAGAAQKAQILRAFDRTADEAVGIPHAKDPRRAALAKYRRRGWGSQMPVPTREIMRAGNASLSQAYRGNGMQVPGRGTSSADDAPRIILPPMAPPTPPLGLAGLL